jgi:hypothetical protein
MMSSSADPEDELIDLLRRSYSAERAQLIDLLKLSYSTLCSIGWQDCVTARKIKAALEIYGIMTEHPA